LLGAGGAGRGGVAWVSLAFVLLGWVGVGWLLGKLVADLAGASGPEGMIGGQILDMEGEGKVLALGELQRMHGKKTGALLTAACRMGAVAAEATEGQLAAVTRFGRHLGLAFQIVDDVLDVTATAEQMGKATHKDVQKGKNTYPVLMGLEGSKKEAGVQLGEALGALESLGDSGDALRTLAKFVVEREK